MAWHHICLLFFRHLAQKSLDNLTYFKEILAKMTENLPEDGVQSRQAVAQRCCLNYEPILIPANISAPEPKRQTPLATNNGMDREAASSPSI